MVRAQRDRNIRVSQADLVRFRKDEFFVRSDDNLDYHFACLTLSGHRSAV